MLTVLTQNPPPYVVGISRPDVLTLPNRAFPNAAACLPSDEEEVPGRAPIPCERHRGCHPAGRSATARVACDRARTEPGAQGPACVRELMTERSSWASAADLLWAAAGCSNDSAS